VILEEISDALRADLESSGARVRFGFPRWLSPLLFRQVAAVALGRRIYLTPLMSERSVAEVEALLRHERTHVRQAARLGLTLFLYRYASEYIRLRLRGRTGPQAYREISFEREAFEAEEE
jgi:Domain of unknown function (DUF4157)